MIVDALVERIHPGRAKYDRNARIALERAHDSGASAPDDARAISAKESRRNPPGESSSAAYAHELLAWGKQHYAARRPGAHRDGVHCPLDRGCLPPLDFAAREGGRIDRRRRRREQSFDDGAAGGRAAGHRIFRPSRLGCRGSQGSIRVRGCWRTRPFTDGRTIAVCDRREHPVVIGKIDAEDETGPRALHRIRRHGTTASCDFSLERSL